MKLVANEFLAFFSRFEWRFFSIRFLMVLGVALLANGVHALSPLTDVSKIAIGSAHTCALMQDKSVQCWGYNGLGALGNGTTVDSGYPVPVTGLSGVIAISAGAIHACALLSDGEVRCWGYNSEGSIGNPSVTYTATTPVAVVGLAKATAMSAGYAQTCALLTDGSISCWGRPYANKPTAIAGITGATSVAAGGRHSCALLANGTVACWGENVNGQLGHGSNAYSSDTPVLVSGLVDALAIVAGDFYTCALRRAGSVVCWGQNIAGELGNGATNDSNIPVRTGSFSDIAAISAGARHACALTATGSVFCWGVNAYASLGNEHAGSTSTPVKIESLSVATMISASKGNGSTTCMVLADRTTVCFGGGPLGNGVLDPNRRTRTAVGGISDIVAVKAGHNHTCAVGSDGAISCWGDNSSGQLGSGRATSSGYPVSVVGLLPSIAVAPGNSHTCALTRIGTVWCWGGNRFGQLGIGTLTNSSAPMEVRGLSGVRSLAAADFHTCALLITGAVQCRGSGQNGELILSTFR